MRPTYAEPRAVRAMARVVLGSAALTSAVSRGRHLGRLVMLATAALAWRA